MCVCVETGKQPGKTTKSLNPSYNPEPKVHCFLSQGTPSIKVKITYTCDRTVQQHPPCRVAPLQG